MECMGCVPIGEQFTCKIPSNWRCKSSAVSFHVPLGVVMITPGGHKASAANIFFFGIPNI